MTNADANIILVDDDNFLLEMYGLKFTHEGFKVQTCTSVKAAIEHIRSDAPVDVIVFDLVMPEQDGFSLLETLQSEKLATHALKIALTNQGSDVERKRALDLGADEFVQKASMIPSEVVAYVREALAKHRA
jgi:DNA-binding response OmpR family regulator